MLIRKTSRSMEYQFMFRNSEQKHSTELSWIVSGRLSILTSHQADGLFMGKD